MNLVLFYALIFVAIPLGMYLLFTYIIIFHIKKYGLEKDVNRRVILVFCLGMIAISLMILQEFSSVNWNRVSVTRFIEDSDFNIFL